VFEVCDGLALAEAVLDEAGRPVDACRLERLRSDVERRLAR
jgi:hypothetical protein